jgi:rod shape determining protein RodA
LVTLFNLTADPFGSSYNAIQSLISIGSGGFFGKGLGEGTQSVLRFLPERQTDFIFASISEGLGFLGGISILCLLCFLLYRIYKVSQNIDDKYPYLIVMGVFFLILVQTVTNIGMNMGMMPIIGVTLPMVSYGGSSLVTNFILLGIVSSIGYEYKRRKAIEII